MKRFWAAADVAALSEGFAVRLDGKPVKLPGGGELILPFAALAEAIAAEWAGAPENFTPDHLPLTRLAATARERVRKQHAEIVRQLCAYGMNDLLCYRAPEPEALVAAEDAAWQPWLDWAAARYGARLVTGVGISPVTQSPEAEAAFSAHLSAMSDYQLAGLGVIAPALGSLVLALAVEAGALAPEAACETAHLDEIWQAGRWGDDEAAAARRAKILEDVAVSARFMQLSLDLSNARQ